MSKGAPTFTRAGLVGKLDFAQYVTRPLQQTGRADARAALQKAGMLRRSNVVVEGDPLLEPPLEEYEPTPLELEQQAFTLEQMEHMNCWYNHACKVWKH